MENIIKDLVKLSNKEVFEVKGNKEFSRSKIESLFKSKLKNIYNSSLYSYTSCYSGNFVKITCYSIEFPSLEFWFKEKEYSEEELKELANLKILDEYIVPYNKRLFHFSFLKINNKVVKEKAYETFIDLIYFKVEKEVKEFKKIYEEKNELLNKIKEIKSSL